MSDTFYLPSVSSTFGSDEPREKGPETPLEPSMDMAPEGGGKTDMTNDILRLMQLQRGVGPTDASSTGQEFGPVNAEFTTLQRSGSPLVGDVNRLRLGGGAPITDDVRLGANVFAQQDQYAGGNTFVRPSLNVGYGPVGADVGYAVRSPQQAGQQFTALPSYGFNVNLPVAGGDFGAGFSKTQGQQNPYMYANYQYPFLGGTLGVELSSADRLRNLAALLAYRRLF